MENDLAEIKERQDLLEAHLNALESRLDGQQGWTDIVTAMLGPAARANVEPTAPAAQDVDNAASAEVDVAQLLRSIVLSRACTVRPSETWPVPKSSGSRGFRRAWTGSPID
jgi:hypothetical protein